MGNDLHHHSHQIISFAFIYIIYSLFIIQSFINQYPCTYIHIDHIHHRFGWNIQWSRKKSISIKHGWYLILLSPLRLHFWEYYGLNVRYNEHHVQFHIHIYHPCTVALPMISCIHIHILPIQLNGRAVVATTGSWFNSSCG